MDDYSCRSCGDYLKGRQALFCSEKCRKRHARAEARSKGMSAAEADRKAREERAAELKRQAEQAEKAAAIKAQRLGPCAECGEPFRRTRGRGRIATYCSVACRSKAQRQRQPIRSERNTVPDEFDQMLERVNRDNEERRAYFGASLAALEERYTNLENDVFRAVELGYDRERCDVLLRGLAEMRDELNAQWSEIEKSAPDWSVFYVG